MVADVDENGAQLDARSGAPVLDRSGVWTTEDILSQASAGNRSPGRVSRRPTPSAYL